MMKLRVGLIGQGPAWDARHAPALRALGDRFEVRATYEHVAMLAEQLARQFDATPVEGFRALTAREDIDAVLILSREWYGSLPILAACDAGKAVYCAAGLDLDPERVRHIRQRVAESGIAFMAEFPRRQAPATLRLKELIATRLGTPRLLFCHRREGAGPIQAANGSKVPAMSPVHELIDLVDWCCYVVGRSPATVLGVMHRAGAEAREEEDYQMMSLDFPAADAAAVGVTAQISYGRYVPANWQEAVSFRPPAALQVTCEYGIAFIDLPSTLVWFDDAGRHVESLDSERPVGEQLLSQFYRSVTSFVHNPSGIEDAYRAQAIVLKARESHQRGERVETEM